LFVTSLAATAAVSKPASEAVAAESDFNLDTPTGTIFGTLLFPSAGGPVPGALIVAGSGPTDRNGNSPSLALDTYKKLAVALADRGIASVRYDKRGVALSHAAGGDESTLRFGTYVDDAVAWLQKLHADKRFAGVSLVGHSEGSLLGMIAAQRAPVDAYISLEGAGFPADQILRTQLAAQPGIGADLVAECDRVLDRLVGGHTVTDYPPALVALFRPSIQPYLISWFAYDPRIEIARLTGRVTIVQGTHDVQVAVADGRALASANAKATFVLIDGMTHVLSDDPATTLSAQLTGAYADAARPLDTRLIEATVKAIRPTETS